MGKVIAIANQKGGVAKTTTAGSLSAGLKKKGFKVLAIDLDPQGNLSDSLKAENEISPTIYEILKDGTDIKTAIQSVDACDIIPANIMLASTDLELTATGKEYRLKESLTPILNKYDYIILDTPPSLGIMTVNAFTAANEIIIPTTPGIFATSGIMQLNNTIETVKKYCNPELKIAGILLTKYNPRITINRDIKDLTEQLGTHIKASVFKTFIRASVVVEEAQANKQDIFTYNRHNTVSKDYLTFIKEYLKGEKNYGK